MVTSLSYGALRAGLVSCAVLAAPFFLTGCGEDIRVYRVAKEERAGVDPHAGHNHGPGEGHGQPALPKLEWKLPVGWEETPPGEMRLASFRITADGKVADLGVFPLPGMAGGELGNVNRWRGQVGLEPVSQEELTKITEPIKIDGTDAKLFDLAGENPSSGEPTRILAAILNRDNTAWFFKLNGDDKLVAANKAKFQEFLTSLKFSQAQPALPPDHPPIEGMGTAVSQSAPAATPSPDRPQWEIPQGWQEVPGGAFLIAKFKIPGGAAVNVSMSPGDGGGVFGNVNRWRGQVGLEQLPEAEVSKLLKSEETPQGKLTIAEMSGKDARTGASTSVVGAILPVEGKTWFYKLMGDEQAVAREKEALLKFIRSARYSHAS